MGKSKLEDGLVDKTRNCQENDCSHRNCIIFNYLFIFDLYLNNFEIIYSLGLEVSKYLSQSLSENNISTWESDPQRSLYNFTEEKIKSHKAEIITDAHSLCKRLHYEDQPQPIPEKCFNYSRSFNGHILKVNTLDDFFVQDENADLQLMFMKQFLDKCQRPYEKSHIQFGLNCVAPYHVDRHKYRAQVTEINKMAVSNTSSQNNSFNQSLTKSKENKVKVLYIDYGNEDYVDACEIYKTTMELKSIPPLAQRCRLNLNTRICSWMTLMKDGGNNIINELIECFKSMTSKSVLSVNVIDGTDNLVDIFICSKNICDLLVENTINNMKQAEIIERGKNVVKELEFSGRVVNYELNLCRFGTEIRTVNESVLKFIEQSSISWTDCANNSRSDDVRMVVKVARIPELLTRFFQTKQKFGRVSRLNYNIQFNHKLDFSRLFVSLK